MVGWECPTNPREASGSSGSREHSSLEPLDPEAVHKDATYVRLNSEWHPNPINHFLAALFSGLLVVLWVPYFGYYLYERHTHLGLF
jgi:hypothetical protein